jgi:hypothetical protein
MKHNEYGPVAETYRELQGLVHIEAAYKSLNSIDPLNRAYYIALQSIELIYFNAADLLHRFNILFDFHKSSTTVRHLLWLEELFDIAIEFARLASLFRSSFFSTSAAAQWESPSLQQFSKEYHATEERMIRYCELNQAQYLAAISTGMSNDPQSVTVHSLKNIFHAHRIISKWLPDVVDSADHIAVGDVLSSEELKKAVFGISLNLDCFITQFRLLHQIPELCGLLCVDLLADASEQVSHVRNNRLHRTHVERLIDSLFVINVLAYAMILCNRPLRKLMLPSEYYLIRANLGQTSGSHSKTLRGDLLSKSYIDFAAAVSALPNWSAPENKFKILVRGVLTLQSLVYEWRALHLAFPRNLLGGFGTKSLIGSPDGLTEAKNMSDRFAQLDPIGKSYDASNTEEQFIVGSRLDQKLLNLTSRVAKGKFEDVQNRTGVFAPKGVRQGS